MSQKLAGPITLIKYLNKLHKDERQQIDEERDLKCWVCGKYFESEDVIIPQTGAGKAGRKKRHPECAYRVGLITKDQLEKLKQFKNMVYVGLMAGWLMVMAQHVFLVRG